MSASSPRLRHGGERGLLRKIELSRDYIRAGAIFSLPSSSTRVLCQGSHCSFLSTEEGDGWTDGRLFAVQLSGASVWSAHRPGNSRVAHHWGGFAAASHYRSSITHVVRPVMNRAACPRGESLVKQKKLMTRFCNAAKTVTDCFPLNGLKLNPRHSSARVISASTSAVRMGHFGFRLKGVIFPCPFSPDVIP